MTDEKKPEITDSETEEDGDSHPDRKIKELHAELWRLRKERSRQRKKLPRPSRSVFWGLMLILWAVLILLTQQKFIAPQDIWKYFLIGLGSIFIVQAALIYLNPTTRNYTVGRLIPGFILLFVGIGFLVNFNNAWPVALIAAGVSVIFFSWFLQREIEKRKLTQENLYESEVKYRHIIDNANSIIMEIDTTGNITFINKFGSDFFGFQEMEMLGHNMAGTILPYFSTDGQTPQKLIEDVAQSPGKYLHYEKENLRKNGEKVWITWTYKPIFDETNNLKEVLCIGIDSTQQKQAEESEAQQLKEKTAEEERIRLARDLHDAVSQTLFSTSLIAEVLPKLWERNKDEGLKKLEEVRLLTRGALAEMRTLLFELRPAALADAELNDLLRQLSESVIGRARVPVTLEVEGNCAVPTDVKIALYRIAQEALNNIAKHSGASHAQISLHCQPHQVAMNIIDNGHGFDSAQTAPGSFGMGNMNERANHIGAALKIVSKVGEGTEISVVWQDNAGEKLK
jgi:PAS domain S-box-containing protein